MSGHTIGFIGVGRLGLPVATRLIEAGHTVVCCNRGRCEELVRLGATVAGDGSPRAVAEEAGVVFTCLPADAVETVIGGANGVLEAAGPLPTVVELSTAPVAVKQALRGRLQERGGDLLDCPVSGTPAMVNAGIAVVFASGERATYDEVAGLLAVISPGTAFVGELGNGTKMKYIANLLVLVNLTAAAEAMALASALGLDPHAVVEVVSSSPAATSGQFAIRGPMIADEQFEGRLVEVRDSREVLEQVTAAAREAGAAVPLATLTKELFDELGERGDDGSDPAKVTVLLRSGTGKPGWVRRGRESPPSPEDAALLEEIGARSERMINRRLYTGLSRVNPASPPPPPRVIKEHLDYAERLERTGVLFAAGPFVDDADAMLGDGMFVVRAQSAAEATELLAEDPFHVGGFRRFTVHGWSLHQGALNVGVAFSDQRSTFS